MIEGQMETSLPTTDSPDTGGQSGLSDGAIVGIFSVVFTVLTFILSLIYRLLPREHREAIRMCCRKPCKGNSSDPQYIQTDRDTESGALEETTRQSQMDSTKRQMQSTSQDFHQDRSVVDYSAHGPPIRERSEASSSTDSAASDGTNRGEAEASASTVLMAARDARRSKFFTEGKNILELLETIDAPRNFTALALDLVESQVEVSSIIGKMSTDYEYVVFNCLTSWRDASGSKDEQCTKLIRILEQCQLTDQASWLQTKQREMESCLSNDGVLLELSTKIDCPTYHQKLCLQLVTEEKLSNMIGPNRPPDYKGALYRCFIQFRNREGTSMETAKKLRKILTKHKLKTSVDMLEELEPGLQATDGNGD